MLDNETYMLRQEVNFFRKLYKTHVNFKSEIGWFILHELKILERSGYALFKTKDGLTMYIAVIEPNRRQVIHSLVIKIRNNLFWTSTIDLGRIVQKNYT